MLRPLSLDEKNESDRPHVSRMTSIGREVAALVKEAIELGATRQLEKLRARGPWARPLDFDRDRVVLLFYEDFDRDRFVPGDRHAIRTVRRVVHAARNRRRVTGFGVAFAAIVVALQRAGYVVRLQDEALARANPNYPVGVAGYPHVLDLWSLPNPVVLGPGLLDHPSLHPHLMSDPRFVRYIVPCGWMRDLFGRVFPLETIGVVFSGIDTDAWPDTSACDKDLDFIVYDKIHWDRSTVERDVVAPILSRLRARGQSFERLTYGSYDHVKYRALLRRARGLLYLSEHETQGLAYQEALASNVPVMAWDAGEWRDPIRVALGEGSVHTSSVPYFDARCGERFRDAAEFPAALERFLASRPTYAPRQFVLDELSLSASAQAYVRLYRVAWERGKNLRS